jgi:beta-carotene 15,15'-dioxygenase
LLASALLFGLPHGAYDFWILSDATQHEPNKFRSLFKKSAIYLLLVIVTVGVWYFLPSVALISFLALTAWHFGSGDAIWESVETFAWLINSLGRGLLIISAPLAFYPKETGFVLAKLDANSTEMLIYLAPFTLTIGIILQVINAIYTLKTDLQTQISAWLEPVILLIFFWLTTPLLAVTVYLVGVHSWRHLLRLNVYERTGNTLQNNGLWRNVSRFHRRALPLTLISLSGLGLIFWMLNLRVSELFDNTSAYLILLSALTVPHAMLITWTENRRRKSADVN